MLKAIWRFGVPAPPSALICLIPTSNPFAPGKLDVAAHAPLKSLTNATVHAVPFFFAALAAPAGPSTNATVDNTQIVDTTPRRQPRRLTRIRPIWISPLHSAHAPDDGTVWAANSADRNT